MSLCSSCQAAWWELRQAKYASRGLTTCCCMTDGCRGAMVSRVDRALALLN